MNPSDRFIPALYKRLGSTIRERRRELGMTQRRLSDKLEISRASLASVETGRQRIFIHQLYRFAEQLDTEVSALLPSPQQETNLELLDDLRFSVSLSLSQREQIAKLLRTPSPTIPESGANKDDHRQHTPTGEVSS